MIKQESNKKVGRETSPASTGGDIRSETTALAVTDNADEAHKNNSEHHGSDDSRKIDNTSSNHWIGLMLLGVLGEMAEIGISSPIITAITGPVNAVTNRLLSEEAKRHAKKLSWKNPYAATLILFGEISAAYLNQVKGSYTKNIATRMTEKFNPEKLQLEMNIESVEAVAEYSEDKEHQQLHDNFNQAIKYNLYEIAMAGVFAFPGIFFSHPAWLAGQYDYQKAYVKDHQHNFFQRIKKQYKVKPHVSTLQQVLLGGISHASQLYDPDRHSLAIKFPYKKPCTFREYLGQHPLSLPAFLPRWFCDASMLYGFSIRNHIDHTIINNLSHCPSWLSYSVATGTTGLLAGLTCAPFYMVAIQQTEKQFKTGSCNGMFVTAKKIFWDPGVKHVLRDITPKLTGSAIGNTAIYFVVPFVFERTDRLFTYLGKNRNTLFAAITKAMEKGSNPEQTPVFSI